MTRSIVRLMTVSATLAALLLTAADWTRFRGPDATGVSDETGTPLHWGPDENIAWKTALPGHGSSSPVTLGDRIFLTAYGGYGLDVDEPGDQDDLMLHVLGINRADGSIVWDTEVKPRLPEPAFDGGFIRMHGYASSTPATDGERLYVFFGRTGVMALTLDGRTLWQTSVGDGTHNWGSASSPVLHENLVIVNASVESGAVVALDKTWGKEVWRTEDIRQSWSTPLVVDLPDGGRELVVSVHGKILGLDPGSGEKLWESAGVEDYVCPAVIDHDGVVYVTGGRGAAVIVAVRAGGRGDVSETHELWRVTKTPKVATPLYHDGLLHWIDQRGVAVCLDAKTGDVKYEERLEIKSTGDKVYASPVYADGKIYCVTREDGTIVLAPGPQFEILARNDLGDRSIFNGTPTPSRGQLLLRSDRYLYCLGKKG